MRYNLSNGGLVTILNNKIYITDIKKIYRNIYNWEWTPKTVRWIILVYEL